jgi:hypothetical protein
MWAEVVDVDRVTRRCERPDGATGWGLSQRGDAMLRAAHEWRSRTSVMAVTAGILLDGSIAVGVSRVNSICSDTFLLSVDGQVHTM